MIRLILFVLTFGTLMAFDAMAQSRDVYTISGIEVDERAATVAEAQQKAFAAAKIIGAQRLIERFTLPEDRLAATDLIIDQDLADRIAAAVDVEQEVAPLLQALADITLGGAVFIPENRGPFVEIVINSWIHVTAHEVIHVKLYSVLPIVSHSIGHTWVIWVETKPNCFKVTPELLVP